MQRPEVYQSALRSRTKLLQQLPSNWFCFDSADVSRAHILPRRELDPSTQWDRCTGCSAKSFKSTTTKSRACLEPKLPSWTRKPRHSAPT
jgi:hypothetical protein